MILWNGKLFFIVIMRAMSQSRNLSLHNQMGRLVKSYMFLNCYIDSVYLLISHMLKK